jgi:hypothetical protein
VARGGVCLLAGDDGSHAVEAEVEGQGGAEEGEVEVDEVTVAGVEVVEEGEGEPRASPRQIRPSAGPTAYAGAQRGEGRAQRRERRRRGEGGGELRERGVAGEGGGEHHGILCAHIRSVIRLLL